MADFQSFRGLRPNTDKLNLSDVLAPPYDVIKGAMRAELMARSPYNIVRVELAAPYGEPASDEQYEQCAALLKQWREAEIYVRDDPAFYVYEQEFVVPGLGERKRRRGILGALALEEFGEGVKPHEHTLSGPKEDRLKLLRAVRANTSPIFGLFDDDDGWAAILLENVCLSAPLCQATDSENITHRLWRVTDDETVNAIEAALENEPIFIADGHHRYETALNYRNEQMLKAQAENREWTGAEAANRVLMMCVSTGDPGLVVLPTHRVVKAEASKIAALQAALAALFEMEAITGEEELMRRLGEKDEIDTPRMGMHLEGQSFLLRLKAGDAHRKLMDAGHGDAYNALDVTILHTLILEGQLGIGAQELAAGGHVSYTIDARDALSKVDGGEYQAAFLLRSTPVEQVQEVASQGDKMPQKSTYFYPKLVTGLVLRPLD